MAEMAENQAPVQEPTAAVPDEMSELKSRLERMNQANTRLIELFDQNPEIPEMLSLMDKGATFTEALAHVVDVSELTPAEGDPDYDGWTKASQDRMKKKGEREKYLSELDGNLQMSQQEIDSFIKENKLSEAEGKQLLATLDDMMEQVYNGKISKEFLAMLRKATTFDNEVETARRQGEVKARNEKIEIEKTRTSGDGLPELGNAAEMPAPEKQEPALLKSINKFNKKQVF